MNIAARRVMVKELREMARDKRVVQATVVMPVFIIALFVFLLGYVGKQVSKPESMPIAVLGLDQETLKKQLAQSPDTVVLTPASVEEGKRLLKEKDARIFLVYPQAIDLQNPTKAEITAYYNSDDPLSFAALRQVQDSVAKGNAQIAATVLENNNLDPGLADALTLNEINTAQAEGIAGSPLVTLLPYLIVLWAFYGGMSIVSDLVAGEKERGTMETLLISPLRRTDIALGKIGALFVVCLVSSLTTLVGITVLGSLPLEITREIFPTGLAVSLPGLLLLILVLATLCLFFASLMVAISAYARNIRESQTYLSLLSFLILLPAVFSQFIGLTGSEKAPWVAWTPVLNTAVALKDALTQAASPTVLIGSLATNLVLAALCLFAAVRLFNQEEIVLRS